MFDKIKNHLEDKLEEIEKDMDEDEVPPWFGEKKQTSESGEGTGTQEETEVGGSFSLEESEDLSVVEVEVPGYPKDNLDVSVEGDSLLVITAEGTENREERTYEYELPSDANISEVDAQYEYGVLEVTVPTN
jgi:HSP20 family molecular chaperone IbpA